MLLPSSGEQIKRLGERLASGGPISPEDDDLLEELTACHARSLELARPRLDGLAEAVGTGPLHITARAKTTGTIIEKLRREHRMSLARMQDLAGFRLVGAFDFETQDRLYDEIAARFPADPRPSKRLDRRAAHSHGYRALHAVVSFDGVNIEIQLRTVLQHIWANLMERLADRLGRQIRYGEPPTPPEGMSQEYAEGLLQMMVDTAQAWSGSNIMSDESVDVDDMAEQMWSAPIKAIRTSGVDW